MQKFHIRRWSAAHAAPVQLSIANEWLPVHRLLFVECSGKAAKDGLFLINIKNKHGLETQGHVCICLTAIAVYATFRRLMGIHHFYRCWFYIQPKWLEQQTFTQSVTHYIISTEHNIELDLWMYMFVMWLCRRFLWPYPSPVRAQQAWMCHWWSLIEVSWRLWEISATVIQPFTSCLLAKINKPAFFRS